MSQQFPPLTIRDEPLRIYLELLAKRITTLENAPCCCSCSGGSNTTGAGNGTQTVDATQRGFSQPSGQAMKPSSTYDLSGNTTLTTAELNRTHFITPSTTVIVTLPEMLPGQWIEIVNLGSSTITVHDSTGTTLVSITAGSTGTASGTLAVPIAEEH